jgi:hypothetical protein
MLVFAVISQLPIKCLSQNFNKKKLSFYLLFSVK